MLRIRLWKIVAALSLAIGGAWIGTRWLQHHARAQVTKQLESANGGPVEIATVKLGLRGIDLTGIRLLELGDQPPSWMTIHRIHVALSFWQAISREPVADRILLERPVIDLRFDRSGRLRNLLPSASRFRLPSERIKVVNGGANLQQEGRVPLRASGIDLQIQGAGSVIDVQGEVRELLAAHWKIDAELNDSNRAARIRASTARLPLRADRLKNLSLFPELGISDTELRGVVSTSIDVTYDSARPLVYEAVLEPREISGVSRWLGTEVGQLKGKVTLTKGSVLAEDLTCDVFGGQASLRGDLNLDRQPWRGNCVLTLSEVALQQLPADWGIPPDVAGVLGGEANLQYVVDAVGVHVEGSSAGRIDKSLIFGVQPDPIKAKIDLAALKHEFSSGLTTVRGIVGFDLQANEFAVAPVISRLRESGEFPNEGIDGDATVSARLEVPLESIADSTSYRGSADISFGELSLARAVLKDVHLKAQYERGVAEVVEFTANFIDDSRLFGTARASFLRDLQLSAEVQIERLPLKAASELYGLTLPQGTAGTASGSFQISAPATGWASLPGWKVDGEVRADELTVLNHSLKGTSTRIHLDEGLLVCSELVADWNGIALEVSPTVKIEAPYSFVADFGVHEAEMDDLLSALELGSLPEGLGGRLSLQGIVRGQLAPLTWSAAGTGQLRDVELRQAALPATEYGWSLSQAGGELWLTTDQMFGGEIDLNAAIPLERSQLSTAKLSLRKVNVAEIVKLVGELPVELSGDADAELAVTSFEPLAANLTVAGVSARWDRFAVGNLAATLKVHDDLARYRLTGSGMGAKLEFDGQAELNELRPDSWPSNSGRLTVREGNLSSISAQLPERLRTQFLPLSGQYDAELDVEMRPPGFLPAATGQITVNSIRWSSNELVPRATARLKLTDNTLRLHDFEAGFGNGFLRGELQTNLNAPQAGSALLTATRVDLKRLLGPWPDAARVVQGTIDARAEVDLGDSWSGTTQLSAARTKVMGMDVEFNRLPIDWTFSPSSGRARFDVRANAVRVGGGRVSGKTSVDFGSTLNLKTDLRLSRLDVKPLLPRRMARSGRGRLSGRLKLQGRNVRALNDLQGSFNGDLADAQVLGLPVFRTLDRYFDAGQIGSHEFKSTDVKLRLARGVVSVDRISLANSGVQMLVEGKADTRGRLDFNVTAHVGQFDSQPELRRLIGSVGLLAQPAAPVALLAEANDFLSNRLIYLHIGGTVRRPTTRVRPGPLLQQEAVKFFLTEATGGWR